MPRKRRYKPKHEHFGLFINRKAGGYSAEAVKKLITAVRSKNANWTVVEPPDAMSLLAATRMAAGLRKASQPFQKDIERRGAITSLVACGGDGTVNLVARAACEGSLPLGILPMGRHNNIARSIYGHDDPKAAIDRIMEKSYRLIDVGRVADQFFVGSIGLGFTPAFQKSITERGAPRFGIGWSRLASGVASGVSQPTRVIKVDTFRFEVGPIILNINLLPFTCGLPLDSAAMPDDGLAEIIFDVDAEAQEFSGFVRQVYKKKQLFGNRFRLFRGRNIVIQPTRGDKLYLDGEIVELPTDALEITIDQKKLNVYC